MPTWLWIVIAIFGGSTFLFGAILVFDEIEDWYRRRQRRARQAQAFDEIAAARREREAVLRPIGRVPRDRSAAR